MQNENLLKKRSSLSLIDYGRPMIAKKMFDIKGFHMEKKINLPRRLMIALYSIIIAELNKCIRGLVNVESHVVYVNKLNGDNNGRNQWFCKLYVSPIFPENLVNFLMKRFRIKKILRHQQEHMLMYHGQYHRRQRYDLRWKAVSKCCDKLCSLRDFFDHDQTVYEKQSSQLLGWMKGLTQQGLHYKVSSSEVWRNVVRYHELQIMDC